MGARESRRLGQGRERKSTKEAVRGSDLFLLNYSKQIGPALHVMRVSHQMSQKDLASAIGRDLNISVSQSYVSKIEASACDISLARLGIFCRHLGCMPSDIVRIAESLARYHRRPDAAVLNQITNWVRECFRRVGMHPPTSRIVLRQSLPGIDDR